MPLDSTNSPVVTYQEERFTDLREEGAALFAQHWLEASADRSVPLDVDWQQYENMESIGAMLTVTARRGGELIGYAVYVVWPHLHYRGRLIADADSFFLDPADRRGFVGVLLFREAETMLRARGAHEVWARVKLHVRGGKRRTHDLCGLFRWLGYSPVEIILRKRLI